MSASISEIVDLHEENGRDYQEQRWKNASRKMFHEKAYPTKIDFLSPAASGW